jgi:Zn-dependent protease
MIFNILENTEWDILTRLILVIALPIIVLMSLSIHEYAHGIVSYSLGDTTAKRLGRLTVNPIKHLNPIGTICMLLFGFGWAKPVPVDPRYYDNPKRGMALCGLAGPAINLVIGIKSYGIYCIMVWLARNIEVLYALPLIRYMPDTVYIISAQLFGIIGYYNILLAVFNLLPVLPLDGSRLLYAFLPDKYYFGIMKYERVIMFVMLALLWMGFFDLFIDGAYTLVASGIERIVYSLLDALLNSVSG